MPDLPVYVLANIVINDTDTYRLYEKNFFPILKKHGGEFITFDDDVQTLEGEAPVEGRIILIKFASEAAAKTWYDDPDYQEISQHRRAGANLKFLSLVHSLPPRG